MSNIIDIKDFLKKAKSEEEKVEFIKAQHKAMLLLLKENDQLKEKILNLEDLLKNNSVQVISNEELLINDQINIIKQRSLGNELDLEDIKKLDLLLKNKKLLKDDPETFKADPKKLVASSEELMQLAKLPSNSSS